MCVNEWKVDVLEGAHKAEEPCVCNVLTLTLLLVYGIIITVVVMFCISFVPVAEKYALSDDDDDYMFRRKNERKRDWKR